MVERKFDKFHFPLRLWNALIKFDNNHKDLYLMANTSERNLGKNLKPFPFVQISEPLNRKAK